MDFSGICFWITEDQKLRSYHQEYDFPEEEAAREWRSLDIFLSTSLTSNFQGEPLDGLALDFHIYDIKNYHIITFLDSLFPKTEISYMWDASSGDKIIWRYTTPSIGSPGGECF